MGPVDEKRRLILTEALALADEQGLAAVSMRAVAERVGLTSMALYPYVGSKQAVLDGLVDVLLAELLDHASAPSGDWADRLRTVARATRTLATAHPGAYPLLILRPSPTLAYRPVAELLYAALLDAGVPEPAVPRLGRLIWIIALGHGTAAVSGRFVADGPTAEDAELPAHRQLRSWFDAMDLQVEFEADLDDLVRLVAATVAAATSGDRTR